MPHVSTTRRPLGRRALLRAAAAGGLVVAGGGLAGCGDDAKAARGPCVTEDVSADDRRLVFANWPEYIDRRRGRIPTLAAFERRTGIRVDYREEVESNADWFVSVQDDLAVCRPTGRDLGCLSDWMVARVVRLGWAQELDHDNLPNVTANLREKLKDPSYDPGRRRTVPWQSGFTGIAYNRRVLPKGLGSFEELLTRRDLRGQVAVLREMPETMGFALRTVGANPDGFDDDEWRRALDRLSDSVGSGQLRRFTGNDYLEPLARGEVAACLAWSGDILAMQDPDVVWVVPEEGLMLWEDDVFVPVGSSRRRNAEALIDHYYDPRVAAQVAAAVWYVCPVEGVQEEMEKVAPELVDEPLIFPSDELLGRSFRFLTLDEDTARRYDADFASVIG